ncbi:MAG: hypothetical protein AAB874_06800, partial [Patescibacteria group bacterium]
FDYMVSFKEGLQTDYIGSVSGTTTLMSDIIFFGRPYLNADSGGYAMVASGTREVAVIFDSEYLQKPVIQATMSFEDVSTTEFATSSELTTSTMPATTTLVRENDIFSADIRYIVSRATVKGFVIVLNKLAPFDIKFDWLALAVKNPKLFGFVTSTPVTATTTPPVIPTPDLVGINFVEESLTPTITRDIIQTPSSTTNITTTTTTTIATPAVIPTVVEESLTPTTTPDIVPSTSATTPVIDTTQTTTELIP